MTNDFNWEGKHILIVEDEDVNCYFFQMALKKSKAILDFAKDGNEGVRKALSDKHYDCVLMDIRLPGIDGYEATAKIKETKPDLPIIVQTAYAMKNEQEKAFESGCDDYIAKPIRLEVLLEVLAKYLG